MINNEFHCIGIATSNYTDIGNNRYKSYLLRVEIEKFGSKNGKNFEIEVQIYGTNEKVDTRVEVLGQQIAVNGYIDTYQTKEGTIIVKLVAQNVYVLGNNVKRQEIKAFATDTNTKELDYEKILNEIDKAEQNAESDDDQQNDEVSDGDDDDLPF